MGYRSEVGLVIERKTYNKKVTPELREALKDCDSIYTNEEAYYFRWSSVKWYDSFPNVTIVESFVEENEDKAGLVIIGEETDDNRIIGKPYNFEMFIHRAVGIPSADEVTLEDFFALNSVKFIKEK